MANSEPGSASTIRKILPFTTALLAAALIYTGYTFYSRHADDAAAAAAVERKKADENREQLERIGGNNLKILGFTASPAVFRRGEKGTVCYSVNNAVAVKIDPLTEPLKPSMTRCVDVAPHKDTTYTLTATDAKGHTQTASLFVQVR